MNVSFSACSNFVKQILALAFVNVLAVLYDGQFLWLAIGLDALVLGYDLKNIQVLGELKKSKN